PGSESASCARCQRKADGLGVQAQQVLSERHERHVLTEDTHEQKEEVDARPIVRWTASSCKMGRCALSEPEALATRTPQSSLTLLARTNCAVFSAVLTQYAPCTGPLRSGAATGFASATGAG